MRQRERRADDRVLLRLLQPVDLSGVPQHPAAGGGVRGADHLAADPGRRHLQHHQPVGLRGPGASGAGQGALFGQGPAGLGARRRPEDQDAAQRLPGEQRQGDADVPGAGSRRSGWSRSRRRCSRPIGATTRDISQDAVLRERLRPRRPRPATPTRCWRRRPSRPIKDQLRANTDEVMRPRRLRLADHLRRRVRHVLRQRPPAPGPRRAGTREGVDPLKGENGGRPRCPGDQPSRR